MSTIICKMREDFLFFCRHVDLNCCNLWRNLTRQRHNQTEALTTTLQRLTHLLPCPCSFFPTDGMQCNDHKTCCNPYECHCIACKISPEDDKNAVKVTMVFAEITAWFLIDMAQFYTNTWFCNTHGRHSNVCKISLKIEKSAVKFTILLVWMNIVGYLKDIFQFKTNTGVCNDHIFQLNKFSALMIPVVIITILYDYCNVICRLFQVPMFLLRKWVSH